MYRVDLPILIPNLLYRLGVFVVLKYRLLRYGYTYRLIRVGRGKYTKVAPEDYEWLGEYDWHIRGQGRSQYAVRIDGKKLFVYMQREIMKAPKGVLVDHINGDGLDNRRANLRFATCQQNSLNSRPRRGKCTSKYKGVHWDKDYKKWRADIKIGGKRMRLCGFDNEIDAAKARDEAAKKYHGEFAWLNFPDD